MKRPDVAWKWGKWTIGFWVDRDNKTYFGIDLFPLEIVWRMEGYRNGRISAMRNDMWLVTGSVEQGVFLRCFVKGTSDPKEAVRVGLERLGIPRALVFEAIRVHNAVTIRQGSQ